MTHDRKETRQTANISFEADLCAMMCLQVGGGVRPLPSKIVFFTPV